MNLLGMGPGELLLIAMLGLIVFGPGRLPEIASQVGRAVRDLRRSTSEMTQEFQEAMRPLNEVAAFPKEISGAVGAAAVIAQQGVAGQEDAPNATAPEPPTTDASEWHWEGSETTASILPAASSTAGSFWDWDTPVPAPAPPVPAPAASSEPAAATANGSAWEWDEASSPTPSQEPAAAVPSTDAAALAASPNGAASSQESVGEARTDQESAEPEPDVALVGESAAAPGATGPSRRKKADPAEGSA